MSTTHRRGAVLAVLTVVALVAALVALAVSRDSSERFVSRDGSSFRIGDKPFRFVGFNLYDAAASRSYSCQPDSRLDDDELEKVLRYAHDEAGATVLRFWAFQTYTAGGTDFSGVDRVLRIARRVGLRVIPVLEDGPGHCSTGGAPGASVPLIGVAGDTWYTQGYRTPYGRARLSFRDYARLTAQHYRNNPTIMAWMLVNEAETHQRTPANRSALVPFAQDVGSVIRSVDRRHLITLGTQGNGAPGASGPDFRDVYSLPVLDFAEVHDWAFYGNDAEPMPGATGGRLPPVGSPECTSQQAPIACSFATARELGKPLVVGEAGIIARSPAEQRQRAQRLRAKIWAAFDAGAQGYLIWQLNIHNTDGYAVVPDDDDPLVGVLKDAATRIAG